MHDVSQFLKKMYANNMNKLTATSILLKRLETYENPPFVLGCFLTWYYNGI